MKMTNTVEEIRKMENKAEELLNQVEELKKESRVFGIDFSDEISFYENCFLETNSTICLLKEIQNISEEKAENMWSNFDRM